MFHRPIGVWANQSQKLKSASSSLVKVRFFARNLNSLQVVHNQLHFYHA